MIVLIRTVISPLLSVVTSDYLELSSPLFFFFLEPNLFLFNFTFSTMFFVKYRHDPAGLWFTYFKAI